MSKYKCVELILLRPPIGDQTERNTIMLHKLQPTLSPSLLPDLWLLVITARDNVNILSSNERL